MRETPAVADRRSADRGTSAVRAGALPRFLLGLLLTVAGVLAPSTLATASASPLSVAFPAAQPAPSARLLSAPPTSGATRPDPTPSPGHLVGTRGTSALVVVAGAGAVLVPAPVLAVVLVLLGLLGVAGVRRGTRTVTPSRGRGPPDRLLPAI
jgi:amino acid transporter